MLNREFYEQLYTIEPICIACDLSETGLNQALLQLKFNIEQNSTYILYCGRTELNMIAKILGGAQILVRIEIELQDDLVDEWYLVDIKNKKIIYSPGA